VKTCYPSGGLFRRHGECGAPRPLIPAGQGRACPAALQRGCLHGYIAWRRPAGRHTIRPPSDRQMPEQRVRRSFFGRRRSRGVQFAFNRYHPIILREIKMGWQGFSSAGIRLPRSDQLLHASTRPADGILIQSVPWPFSYASHSDVLHTGMMNSSGLKSLAGASVRPRAFLCLLEVEMRRHSARLSPPAWAWAGYFH
jgi:hypothetical protein